jgi:hypothetical protein
MQDFSRKQQKGCAFVGKPRYYTSIISLVCPLELEVVWGQGASARRFRLGLIRKTLILK